MQPDVPFDWEVKKLSQPTQEKAARVQKTEVAAAEAPLAPFLEPSSQAQLSGEVTTALPEPAEDRKGDGSAHVKEPAEAVQHKEAEPEKKEPEIGKDEAEPPKEGLGPHDRQAEGEPKMIGEKSKAEGPVGDKRKREDSRDFGRTTSVRQEDSSARDRSRYELDISEERARRREENFRRQKMEAGRARSRGWSRDRGRDYSRDRGRDYSRDRSRGRDGYRDRDYERDYDRRRYDDRSRRRDDRRHTDYGKSPPRRGNSERPKDMRDSVCFDILTKQRCSKTSCRYRHPAR